MRSHLVRLVGCCTAYGTRALSRAAPGRGGRIVSAPNAQFGSARRAFDTAASRGSSSSMASAVPQQPEPQQLQCAAPTTSSTLAARQVVLTDYLSGRLGPHRRMYLIVLNWELPACLPLLWQQGACARGVVARGRGITALPQPRPRPCTCTWSMHFWWKDLAACMLHAPCAFELLWGTCVHVLIYT